MRALPHGAVADALATVRTSQTVVTNKDVFAFLVLTAARSGEVRLTTWDEMDLDAAVWTIPAARMKAKRDHRVLLSGRALAILHDVRRRSDGTSLVFRSPRGKPLSDMTLSNLIKGLGIAAVPHGLRSSKGRRSGQAHPAIRGKYAVRDRLKPKTIPVHESGSSPSALLGRGRSNCRWGIRQCFAH